MKTTPLLLGQLVILASSALFSLTLGAADFSTIDVVRGLVGDGDPRMVLIVQEIRLPRVVLALLVGASLGLTGAALQGMLRNPLADPGIIGTSACAGLGAVVALYFGWSALFSWALPLSAMTCAACGTLLLLVVAGRDAGTLTMILSGIAISSLAIALTSLAMNLSPNPYALSEIVLWLLGSLRDRSMDDVMLALPFMVFGMAMMLSAGRGLDALTLGEEAAISLGIRLRRLRLSVIFGGAMAVGAGVAATGSVGFIGLVVPHLLRPLVGHRPSALLLPSALGGALLLSIADIGVRLIPARSEIMLGVLTSLVGVPFFLVLILKTRRSLA